MLPIVVMLLAVVGTRAKCPSNYQSQFMACLMPIRGVMSSGPERNMAEACGKVKQTLQCTNTIFRKCRNNPTVQAMVKGMHLDNMRTMCATYLANNENEGTGCPPKALQHIPKCLTDIAVRSGPGGSVNCSKIKKGLECVESLVTACKNNPQFQSFVQRINLNEIRTSLSKTCTASAPTTSKCKVPRPAKALNRCKKRMKSPKRRKIKPKQRCRAVLKGFKCLRSLLKKCPNDPVISAFTTLENLDRQEASITKMCKKSRPRDV